MGEILYDLTPALFLFLTLKMSLVPSPFNRFSVRPVLLYIFASFGFFFGEAPINQPIFNSTSAKSITSVFLTLCKRIFYLSQLFAPRTIFELYVSITFHYWKYNFLLTPHVRKLVGWSVGRSVRPS